jgi:hypothetical protein
MPLAPLRAAVPKVPTEPLLLPLPLRTAPPVPLRDAA